MRIDYHILFWDKKSFKDAMKYMARKQFKDKPVDGIVLLPTRILPKIEEDYLTYGLCMKAGLIQANKVEFSGREQYDERIKAINIEEIDKVFGTFVIHYKV